MRTKILFTLRWKPKIRQKEVFSLRWSDFFSNVCGFHTAENKEEYCVDYVTKAFGGGVTILLHLKLSVVSAQKVLWRMELIPPHSVKEVLKNGKQRHNVLWNKRWRMEIHITTFYEKKKKSSVYDCTVEDVEYICNSNSTLCLFYFAIFVVLLLS